MSLPTPKSTLCIVALVMLASGAHAQMNWAAGAKSISKGIQKTGLPSRTTTRKTPFLDFIQEQIIDRVSIAGFRRLGYHLVSVSGDESAFGLQNYSGFGGQKFTDIGSLRVSGSKVLGGATFNADIQDSRFRDPQGQKFLLEVPLSKYGKISYGDQTGTLLNTNRLASFTRSLKGFQLSAKYHDFEAKAISSAARGRAKTVVQNGNNSAGPYYLQSSQIITESEIVQVDGVTQQRGVDYSISYEIGSITFTTKTIPPSSVITVTFEAVGANSRPGLLQGVGLSYDFHKAGKVGFTLMGQSVRGSSGGSTRIDRFQGFGAPSTPYTLEFEPLLTQPIIIRVDGVIQVPSIDYSFDPDNSSVFYFTRFIPLTSEVDVTYTPKPTQTVDGNRQVIGFDYRLPIGNSTLITVSQARGELRSPINPSKGMARAYEVNHIFGPWNINARVRDIDPGYVSVETLSFNRNEKSNDVRLTYQPPNQLPRFGVTHNNSYITTRQTDNNGNITFFPTRVVQESAFYHLDEAPGHLPLELTYNRQRTHLGTSDSAVDGMGLQTRGEFRSGSWKFGVNRQNGFAPTSATNPQKVGFTALGFNTGLSIVPNGPFSFDLQSSVNAINSGGDHGTGQRHDATLNYSTSKVNSYIRYSIIDAGGLTNLGGFLNGYGVGLDGSGFSSGPGSTTLIGVANSRQLTTGISYVPSDSLTLSADIYNYHSTGAVSSNTDTTGIGLFASVEKFGQRLTLRTDNTLTKYLDSLTPSTKSVTLTALMEGPITRRLSYIMRFGLLTSSGSSQFSQSGLNFETNITQQLSRKEFLNFEYIFSKTTGYLPQTDVAASLMYQYRFWQAASLNVGWRFRNVVSSDPSITSGAYRFNGLDIELSFSF